MLEKLVRLVYIHHVSLFSSSLISSEYKSVVATNSMITQFPDCVFVCDYYIYHLLHTVFFRVVPL